MYDKIAETPIGDIESREAVCVRTRTPLLSVVMAMRDAGRGAAIVVDNNRKIMGIFTERHLINRVDHNSDTWQDMSVDEVMDPEPKTIEESHFIREALRIMSSGRIRNLPIVDADSQVLGIVTIRDILAHVASCYPAEFLNLPPDPKLEATDLHGG